MKRWLANVALITSFTFSSALASAQAATPTPGGCFPDCRAGYVCVGGQCVSACNPPCPSGQRCTAQATCEVVPTQAPAPPAAAAPAPPPAAAPAPTAPLSPAPPVGTVPLRIEGPYGDHFEVTVTGARTEHCVAPCTLDVAPGRASILVTGDAEIRQDIDVPNGPSTFRIATRSKGRVVAGLVLGGIGGVVSIYLLASQKDSSEITVEEAEQNLYLAVGALALTVTGVILVATAGSNSVTRESASAERPLLPKPSIALWAARAGGGGVLGAALRF